MDDLVDLKRDVTDAVGILRHASRLAHDLSGERPGRAPGEWTERLDCPDCGGSGFGCVTCASRGWFDMVNSDLGEEAVPPDWEAMVTLAGELDALAIRVEAAFTEEIREACEAAEREAMEDDRS